MQLLFYKLNILKYISIDLKRQLELVKMVIMLMMF